VLVVRLSGGPSQLETFDPKPDAPREVRGPFAAISTRIAGLAFSELFPRMAAQADRFAVLRTAVCPETPTHEASRPWLAGDAAEGSSEASRIALSADPERLALSWPAVRRPASPAVSRGYSRGPLCWGCRAAVEWLEHGARLVTLSMFDRLTHRITWDAHAQSSALPATLADYRDHLAPAVDRAIPALLDDLDARGLLSETLVVLGGEFGRTPKLNDRGGRDHWLRCFSVLFAGAGLSGGVVAESDASAAEPRDRPVSTGQIRLALEQLLSREQDGRAARPLEMLWS
jgi:hypothetical protein